MAQLTIKVQVVNRCNPRGRMMSRGLNTLALSFAFFAGTGQFLLVDGGKLLP